ncbi:methyltransferase family protein [Gymnodinialimonas sp.]
MKGFPDLPPLWLLAFMGLAWAMARLVPILTVRAGALQTIGTLVAIAGVGLIFWSAWWFWRKKTTIEPHHTPGTLIIEGPYRLSRNPIYLGMIVILTGQVLWLGALSPALLPPLFLLVLTTRFAKPEEAALLAAFGEEGRAYLAATRRWV